MIKMALVEQEYQYPGDWVETSLGLGTILDIKTTALSWDLVLTSRDGFRDGSRQITISAEDCYLLG